MQRPELAAPPAVAASPATFYCVKGGNDSYWRVEAPARALGAKACLLPEEAHPTHGPDGRFNGRAPGGFYSIMTPNLDTVFPWWPYQDANDPGYVELRYPEHSGAAVWTRPCLVRAKHMHAMQRQGIRTLSEVDDNYLSDPRLNVFQRGSGYGPAERDQHMKATAFADGIVVSTHWLRDTYYKTLRRELGANRVPDIFVCGNHVAAEDWPARSERTGPLRVGWMGSPSHIWDVDLAWGAMMTARQLGCEAWMVGYDPTDPEGSMEAPVADRSPRSAEKIEQWRKVGFKKIPWRKPGRFERFALPFDIGLSPLLRNKYTLGKSDIKNIEYTIAGAAVICSNLEVYSRNWIHGETALLVGSDREMADAVELLVKDDNLRERLVANAQQYVREERSGDVMRREWMAAISG